MMTISTEIYHLQELPRYVSEKPYTMRYIPETEMEITNVVREKRIVTVEDMRGLENDFSLDIQGFTVAKLPSKMAYEDYDSRDMITDVYLPEIEKVLCGMFPGSTVDFVSYLVSEAQTLYLEPKLIIYLDSQTRCLISNLDRRALPVRSAQHRGSHRCHDR